MVMHLTNENHALRMNLQVAGGGAMPTMMMPCVYPPMTPASSTADGRRARGRGAAVAAVGGEKADDKAKETNAACVCDGRLVEGGALRRGGDVAGVVAGGGGCQLALEQSAFARPLRAADGRSVGAIRR